MADFPYLPHSTSNTSPVLAKKCHRNPDLPISRPQSIRNWAYRYHQSSYYHGMMLAQFLQANCRWADCRSVIYVFSMLLSTDKHWSSRIRCGNYLPLPDCSRLPGRFFHIPCVTSPDRSRSVRRGSQVGLVSYIRESACIWTSNLNVPEVQEFCVESLHPGRFLPRVFAFTVQGPAVRQMLQVLIRF
jgi:hypothetical protein